MTKVEREVRTVRIQNATLDDKNGEIVAHGWLDIGAMNELRVGSYQREFMASNRGKKSKIMTAIEEGIRLPDVILGMRGDKFTTRGQTMYLESDVFIVDGLQRISNMRLFANKNPDEAANLRIGAEIRFNTTPESERDLFTALNVNRTSMSPNVILRNARDQSNGLATLYGLSLNDPSFALYGKVCWNQTMNRNEIMTARLFSQSVARLHRRVGTGGSSTATLLPGVLQKAAQDVGLQNFRENTYRFFEVLDEVWGIKGIKYVDAAIHIRSNMLFAVAKMFAEHENFWDGNKLVVDAKARAKMKSFPLDEPTIRTLASGGSKAGELLYRHLIDHMNKGKTINRLVPRAPVDNRLRPAPRAAKKAA